jgi:hypothetical protein
MNSLILALVVVVICIGLVLPLVNVIIKRDQRMTPLELALSSGGSVLTGASQLAFYLGHEYQWLLLLAFVGLYMIFYGVTEASHAGAGLTKTPDEIAKAERSAPLILTEASAYMVGAS